MGIPEGTSDSATLNSHIERKENPVDQQEVLAHNGSTPSPTKGPRSGSTSQEPRASIDHISFTNPDIPHSAEAPERLTRLARQLTNESLAGGSPNLGGGRFGASNPSLHGGRRPSASVSEHPPNVLARQLSQLSSSKQQKRASVNPFLIGGNEKDKPDLEAAEEGSVDPALDPNSPHFSFQKWAQAVMTLGGRDDGYGEKAPGRTSGVSFKNLSAHGWGKPTDFQKDVGNVGFWIGSYIGEMVRFGFDTLMGKQRDGLGGGPGMQKVKILKDFDGLVRSGEMLVVLGRPGSGCSTFLKTIAGDVHGYYLGDGTDIRYQGISYKEMHGEFRGEAIYNAETETHFPNLTVGDTLMFAAAARAPRIRMGGISRDRYAEHMRDVIMAVFGLSHTINTRVGNEFLRGVSGGERKRVSIAEVALSFSPLQCWDNSTRGLDSATALEFISTLRLSTQLSGSTACVSIYQAGQRAYDAFDKVTVLYEGYQIYFGLATEAQGYFERMGFDCPPRQTTGDFLTSLTNPAERELATRKGWENRVPRTAEEFSKRWVESEERKALLKEIDEYNAEFPLHGDAYQKFLASRRAQQSQSLPKTSPYTISVMQQIKICMRRGFQRLRGDQAIFWTTVIGNSGQALITASVFYNLDRDTDSFFKRSALLFFAVMNNAFASFLEINLLFTQRAVVEKHSRYALYHPYAEAAASMIVELPSKIIVCLASNLVLYWMTNLKRTPSAFFIYLLFSFIATITMSSIFRTIAAGSRTLAQAMAPASLIMLALIIYTGFTIPIRSMVGALAWIRHINPIAYAFEVFMVNEFWGRDYSCSVAIPTGPGYENVTGDEFVCSVPGSVPGQTFVAGSVYVATAYNYMNSHKWRNFGILIAFWVFFTCTYLTATELVSAKKSKGEVLVFRRGHVPKAKRPRDDPENGNLDTKEVVVDGNSKQEPRSGSPETAVEIQKQTKTFMWKDVCYDIKIKGKERRILDHVDGWVKPGTLTALMGVSGAGKTTLLDVLATRTTMGVITGQMLVNGRPRDRSFQRKTGYVQQLDIHLETSTVREALAFSAILRQPKTVPDDQKLAYVEDIIKLLDMQDYAEAVVGIEGEGLNVEQRKRLTIAVELVARPQLVLFFDEPSSGLDSQTAWSICQLMRKLANNGQAILCTIHQPSALLIQEFDRLLLLAPGGRTVYFGDMGHNASTLIQYFEKNGAPPCGEEANPAEWMLEVVSPRNPEQDTGIDWPMVWKTSPERRDIRTQITEMKAELSKVPDEEETISGHVQTSDTFAMPFATQYFEVLKRVWLQYWRTPSYIFAKLTLSVVTGLFIGLSLFQAPNSIQGLQNQMFGLFLLYIVFNNLAQQIQPQFGIQRSLYEARERPSGAYSWVAFVLAQVTVEVPWQILTATLTWICWAFPIGLWRNARYSGTVAQQTVLLWAYVVQFFLWSQGFAQMLVAGMDNVEAAGTMGMLLFGLSLLFCGVIANKAQLGWWVWLYRVSPFTYLIDGMLGVAVGRAPVSCSNIEFVTVQPPPDQNCSAYLDPYLIASRASVANPEATSDCRICPETTTDQFLDGIGSSYDHRFRNFGILWVFVFVNILGTLFFYWFWRVPKGEQVKEVTVEDDAQTLGKKPTEVRSELSKRDGGTTAKGSEIEEEDETPDVLEEKTPHKDVAETFMHDKHEKEVEDVMEEKETHKD